MFSLGQANNKKGKLLVSGNTQGKFGGGSGCEVEVGLGGGLGQRQNKRMEMFVKKLISMRLRGIKCTDAVY